MPLPVNSLGGSIISTNGIPGSMSAAAAAVAPIGPD
jgi:hypothetical protein